MNNKPIPRKTSDSNKKPTRTRRKNTSSIKKKVNPSAVKPAGEAVLPVKSFHETFPITLEYMDGKDFKRCFFVCKEHCDTYLKRYNLKKGSYKIFDTKPRNEKEE